MFNPDALAKMTASMQGRTFLSRGGNGQLTKPQLIMHELTGLPMELPISILKEWARENNISSPPVCYKVDLGHLESKLAIEIDGKTHKTSRWKFLDRRKTDILELLGWKVIRLLERGSAGRSPESEGDYRAVYNLEVEGNHNYFANGALVHNCKGIYTAQRAKAFARIARYNEAADKAPFVIWMSATMGQNPIDLGYMAPLIGQINGKPKMTLDEWGPYLEAEGYAVRPQKVGYAWATAKMNATEGERKHVAQVQRKDVERISAILFNPKAPSIRRLPTDIAGWPEQQRVPMGVEFDEEQQRLYQEAWLDFRSQMRLLLKGKNPQGALVAMLRFRQKASLLMVEPGLDHITDLLENGLQVAVSCQFLETIDRLRPLVEKAGYRTAEFSGRIQGDEREAERLKFQKGQAKVIFLHGCRSHLAARWRAACGWNEREQGSTRECDSRHPFFRL